MRILIGVSGGIAAYKIPFLIRLLKKIGAEVKCIMTPASSDFISPLVLSTLSNNPVGIDFWNPKDGTWNNHVAYGEWADLLVIAPATANTLSKMANGTCDNLLLATYLSMRKRTLVVPAMDLDMYAHPSTIRNLKQIEQDACFVIPAKIGELASGLVGEGRMAEPEEIVTEILRLLQIEQAFLNKKILITAGPTQEAIDPVRFIGNNSSGKMGFALAEQALNLGAEVHLVTGPTSCTLEHENLICYPVVSANEMFECVKSIWDTCEIGVFAAAVADYRPVEVAEQKIKKSEDTLQIDLIKNPDIVSWAAAHKNNTQKVIGFALETNNAKENALAKLKTKKMDAIVLNSLGEKGVGFEVDTNKITILDSKGNSEEFELKLKSQVAKDIFEFILKLEK